MQRYSNANEMCLQRIFFVSSCSMLRKFDNLLCTKHLTAYISDALCAYNRHTNLRMREKYHARFWNRNAENHASILNWNLDILWTIPSLRESITYISLSMSTYLQKQKPLVLSCEFWSPRDFDTMGFCTLSNILTNPSRYFETPRKSTWTQFISMCANASKR